MLSLTNRDHKVYVFVEQTFVLRYGRSSDRCCKHIPGPCNRRSTLSIVMASYEAHVYTARHAFLGRMFIRTNELSWDEVVDTWSRDVKQGRWQPLYDLYPTCFGSVLHSYFCSTTCSTLISQCYLLGDDDDDIDGLICLPAKSLCLTHNLVARLNSQHGRRRQLQKQALGELHQG